MNKAVFAFGLLALLAAAAWKTMDSGKPRTIALIVLGGFAIRILLAARSSR